jgi:acyl-CoA synthetase (AMP-forming)/AMP-acid ligase II
LIAFCHEQIAGYKCPKRIEFASDLPRNPSGKLLKRELREQYWSGVDRRVS